MNIPALRDQIRAELEFVEQELEGHALVFRDNASFPGWKPVWSRSHAERLVRQRHDADPWVTIARPTRSDGSVRSTCSFWLARMVAIASRAGSSMTMNAGGPHGSQIAQPRTSWVLTGTASTSRVPRCSRSTMRSHSCGRRFRRRPHRRPVSCGNPSPPATGGGSTDLPRPRSERRSLMTAFDFTGESIVALLGDTHGDESWLGKVLPEMRRENSEFKTILQVGDFGFWPHSGFLKSTDFWARTTGVERVLVTPGNHENWDAVSALFAENLGEPVQVSEVAWLLPRGYRFTIAGRSFLSFGGAGSIDREYRVEGQSWWRDEMPSTQDVEAAVARGPVDIMLTHDMVNGSGIAVLDDILANPGGQLSVDSLAWSALSRGRVTHVWDTVEPRLLVHGHMHAAGRSRIDDEREILSLGCNWQEGAYAFLDVGSLNLI